MLADENVIVFVLGNFVVEVGAIDEMVHLAQFGFDAAFLPEAALGGGLQVFAPARVRAAGVGPQAAEVIFTAGAELEKHLVLRVENEDAEGAVELWRTLVGCEFLDWPKRAIVFVDEDDLLVHRR